jgi:hypothetical protein
MTSGLDGLARIGIDDRGDASLGFADLTSEKGCCPRDNLKFVGYMDEFRQVTVNRLEGDCWDYCLVKDY